MSTTKTVEKEIPLKCLNCGREFDGLAELKEHYIQDGGVLWKTVFNHLLDKCPHCRSPRVVARDENLMS